MASGHEPAAPARTMVYVSNAESQEILVLTLNEADGRAHIVQRVPTAG
ncbi:MAG: hypothetical protein H7Z21_19785, partial [Hymenobacter sp.]|nr:hypothetical protein [Hymenobacter sp.]